MSGRARLGWAALAAGAAVMGLGVSPAMAGGFGFSFGYASGPTWGHGGYCAPVVAPRPAFYGGCGTYVRHGDYYAYPTGRTYVAPSCGPPVVYAPPPAPVVYGGRSFSVGGFFHRGWPAARAVRSYGRRSYGSRRVYVAPRVVRPAPFVGRSFHRGGHRGWGRPSRSFVAPRRAWRRR
jgi:hypothetical protein